MTQRHQGHVQKFATVVQISFDNYKVGTKRYMVGDYTLGFTTIRRGSQWSIEWIDAKRQRYHFSPTIQPEDDLSPNYELNDRTADEGSLP
jgi:hypothetical protein